MKKAIILVGLGRNYKIFIPYYIVCLYFSNPDLHVIVITDDTHIENYEKAMDYASNLYGKNKIKVYVNPPYIKKNRERLEKVKVIPPNILTLVAHKFARCLMPTEYYDKYDYVYVGDVDLLITEKHFFERHIEHAKKCGISFSNTVRSLDENNVNKLRLSGLHFICCKKYISKYKTKIDNFSFGKYVDYVKQNNANPVSDEFLLYYIVDNEEIELLKKYPLYRNFHGIHIGIFRRIYHKHTDMNIYKYIKDTNCPSEDTVDEYIRDIQIIIKTQEFKKIHTLLQMKLIDLLYKQ